MNNYILISRTYTEATPESCENGDYSDKGFIDELVKVSFTELVNLMKAHPNASSCPDDHSTHTWYSTHDYIKDYSTNVNRCESIHFHHSNTSNAAKYWKLARIAANK